MFCPPVTLWVIQDDFHESSTRLFWHLVLLKEIQAQPIFIDNYSTKIIPIIVLTTFHGLFHVILTTPRGGQVVILI